MHRVLRRRLRALLLAPLALAALAGASAPVGLSHCTVHVPAGTAVPDAPSHAHEVASPRHGEAPRHPGPPGECPHCPADQCAQASPCAGSAWLVPVLQAAPARVAADRVAVPPLVVRARSALREPPTPPPNIRSLPIA